MMEEIKSTSAGAFTGNNQFNLFNELNSPLGSGVIYVTPDNQFGVKTADGRVITFSADGAKDVTDISVPVNHVETRTQSGDLKPGVLFVFANKVMQTINDNGSVVKAYDFDAKTIVEVSPERLAFMGNVRAIGVVFMPEATAFGGNMFHALKMLAASANDREGLYELRKKEWVAAQMAGKPAPLRDGLDEMMVFAANPGATQFQSLMQQQQQTEVLARLALTLEKLLKGTAPAPASEPEAPKAEDTGSN